MKLPDDRIRSAIGEIADAAPDPGPMPDTPFVLDYGSGRPRWTVPVAAATVVAVGAAGLFLLDRDEPSTPAATAPQPLATAPAEPATTAVDPPPTTATDASPTTAPAAGADPVSLPAAFAAQSFRCDSGEDGGVIAHVDTGNPVVDCAAALDRHGFDPIDDPVAFVEGSRSGIVVTESERAARWTDAEPLHDDFVVDSDYAARLGRVIDAVDVSTCVDHDVALATVEQAIADEGLVGWTVTSDPYFDPERMVAEPPFEDAEVVLVPPEQVFPVTAEDSQDDPSTIVVVDYETCAFAYADLMQPSIVVSWDYPGGALISKEIWDRYECLGVDEAEVELPGLLAELGIDRPVRLGYQDREPWEVGEGWPTFDAYCVQTIAEPWNPDDDPAVLVLGPVESPSIDQVEPWNTHLGFDPDDVDELPLDSVELASALFEYHDVDADASLPRTPGWTFRVATSLFMPDLDLGADLRATLIELVTSIEGVEVVENDIAPNGEVAIAYRFVPTGGAGTWTVWVDPATGTATAEEFVTADGEVESGAYYDGWMPTEL